MSPLQIRTLARHAVKDVIWKVKDVIRRLSDEGAVDPVPVEKIRERLKDALDRVAVLEGKMVSAKAALLDHEARIAALEGGP